jgi:glycosyltransferase involved in cell wall biosynthesis
MPKISIITVNLNNVNGLNKTIESVICQTFTDYEYLIIDGGSTDGSVDVIKKSANRITYWVSEPDNGIYNAMNKGILQAKGEYLQFLNSGDCLVNENILAKVFEIPRTDDIIYGHLNYVYDKGCIVHKMPEEQQLSLQYFFNHTIGHSSAFIARRLFNDNLYDESYMIGADKKFFIEKIVIKNCTVRHIDEVIVNFDTKGISSDPHYKARRNEEEDRTFSLLFPPCIVKDYEFYKNNSSYIRELGNIKRYKFSYFGFKILVRLTRFYQKYFSS